MSVLMTRRMHHGFGLLNKKYSKRYFTIKNVRDNDLYLYLIGCNAFQDQNQNQSLKYRYNKKGGDWQAINTNTSTNWIPLQGLESIEFSGIRKNSTTNFRIICVERLNSTSPIEASSDYEIHIKGNIMSLFYGDDFLNKISISHNMRSLLAHNQILTDASKLILPATELTANCYESMFQDCTQLINPPKVLPASYGPLQCYDHMFDGCTQLIKTPLIRMTDGYNNNGIGYGQQCDHMFSNCVNLTKAEIWFAISGVRAGYPRPGAATDDMFQGCSGLRELHLYAPKLTQNCYNSILSNYQLSQQLSVYIYAKEADVINPSSDTIWSRYFNEGANWPRAPKESIIIWMLENTGTDKDTDDFLASLKNTFFNFYTIKNTLKHGTYTPPDVDLDTGEPI